ncbi:Dynamin-related protein 5A [Platanthera guangdongensis]|uniref:Dynamin-related protein 5A n=1 Tax=Platanthera guangdongensis TaxID=2320717 RepID=A0ABR2N3L5_9ASPA
MAASAMTTSTPVKTPNTKSHPMAVRRATHQTHTAAADSFAPTPPTAAADFKSRFEAYNRLQAAAFAFGEKLPIPEIVAVGGQSDGKSSLLEALLGFRFNVREVEMGTRRPLVLQMVHDPSSLEPRCRFQDEDSEDYGSPVVFGTAIADLIRSRTDAHLKKIKAAAKKGEPENTPDEILSMVKSLASPPHRLLLFLQQSSVEWCSSLWLDSIKEIDPTFKRTIIDRGMVTNEDFRRQISQVDVDILHHLRENVKGGFNEEKFEPFIGFGCLRKFLECELQKRYKDAAPATLALLEQRCGEISEELGRIEDKLQATSDVSHLRKSAMLHAASICTHVGSLIDGAADPAPEQWGKTTIEEQEESGFGSWPGVSTAIKPANSDLRLYGGAAFERVMYEFRCATYSIECPPVSREKVANILLAHAGRGGGGGLVEAAAEIARAAARAWLAPILETACERLAFVLKSLFDLAVERNSSHDSDFWQIKGDMDGYVGFHASLRRSYYSFVNDLSKHCKQLVHHHLDSVTSPYSQVCYDSDFHGSNSYSRCNQIQSISYFLDMSESTRAQEDMDQENIPPKDQENTTPGKKPEAVKAYRESQMTIPETPSPDLPSEAVLGVRKKDNVNCMDIAGRKRQARSVAGGGGISDAPRSHNPHFSFGDMGKSGSSYVDICSLAAQHFARIREVLVERSASSALNSGFLTPCRERLMVALGLELFAVTDEKFMDMFVAPGAIDALRSEQQSLQKREKILQSCLIEFKNIARAL